LAFFIEILGEKISEICNASFPYHGELVLVYFVLSPVETSVDVLCFSVVDGFVAEAYCTLIVAPVYDGFLGETCKNQDLLEIRGPFADVMDRTVLGFGG
jgi:hypothetical protein